VDKKLPVSLKYICMKNFLFLFALSAVLCSRSGAQNFTIHDVLASSPNARICDIEIDPYKNRICWQTPDDDKLWVCRLDTATWTLVVPDGKETLIDSILTPIDETSNSGEWGYDQSGTYLVYNKVVSRKKYIAVAAETGSGWMTTTLMDAPHTINPHATRNPADTFFAFHYISTIWGSYTKFKFRSNLWCEHWIHGFKDAHWVDGETLLTGILPNHQVALCNPACPGPPLQLTVDNGPDYTLPFMWHAPEHDNVRMFFARVNGEEIRVFKETMPNSFDFRPYLSFTSPSANPLYVKIGSPEPTVYGGQSYISFMVSSSECENSCFPGEIWIAKIDSLAPFFRMVSDSSVGIRSDPETLATKDSLLVFYTEIVGQNTPETFYRLKKCDTGIGVGFMTGVPPVDRNVTKMVVYPNPFTSRLSLKDATGNERFRLTDRAGRTVWTGRHLEKKDFSGLPSGGYILKIGSGGSWQTVELIRQ